VPQKKTTQNKHTREPSYQRKCSWVLRIAEVSGDGGLGATSGRLGMPLALVAIDLANMLAATWPGLRTRLAEIVVRLTRRRPVASLSRLINRQSFTASARWPPWCRRPDWDEAPLPSSLPLQSPSREDLPSRSAQIAGMFTAPLRVEMGPWGLPNKQKRNLHAPMNRPPALHRRVSRRTRNPRAISLNLVIRFAPCAFFFFSIFFLVFCGSRRAHRRSSATACCGSQSSCRHIDAAEIVVPSCPGSGKKYSGKVSPGEPSPVFFPATSNRDGLRHKRRNSEQKQLVLSSFFLPLPTVAQAASNCGRFHRVGGAVMQENEAQQRVPGVTCAISRMGFLSRKCNPPGGPTTPVRSARIVRRWQTSSICRFSAILPSP